MVSKIIWSSEALTNLECIIDYLNSNWTEAEISKFKTQLNRNLEIISQFPSIFPESQIKPGLRRAVLSKQISIIYKILNDAIYLAYLIDNRQDISNI